MHVIGVLREAPRESRSIDAFEELARTLVGWWDDDERDRGRQQRERNLETEQTLREQLQHFLLLTELDAAIRIAAPIVGATDRHPREVQSFLEGLVSAEDRLRKTEQFWAIWTLFADQVKQAPWLTRIDAEYHYGSEMISAIFLGRFWKDGLQHWPPLENYADRLHSLFADLPASPTVTDRYVYCLYHVGRQSLPGAFLGLAEKIAQSAPSILLASSNTTYMLEVLLQEHVFGHPLQLKSNAPLKNAVLSLLDALVEVGSSAAFRMRDDFVTPALGISTASKE